MGALVSTTISGVVSGVISGVLVGVGIALAAPTLASATAQPTCADPGDLTLVTEVPRVTASTQATPPKDSLRGAWQARNVVDGNTATQWVPEKNDPHPKVMFDFADDKEFALICVVNGQVTSDIAYTRAGKARELRTVSTSRSTTRTTILQDLPTALKADRQPIRVSATKAHHLEFDVRSSYPGEEVWDPSTSKYLFASPYLAISEIEFYTCTSHHSWWQLWRRQNAC